MISIDILQYIINDFLGNDIRTIISLIDCCKAHRENLYVYQFNHTHISQELLMQKKYSKLVKLCINACSKVINLNHLADTLKELDCEDTIIDQSCISKLKLTRLNSLHNPNIEDVNYMADTLIDLTSRHITQEGISKLRLVKLRISSNQNVYNVNHMASTLRELKCGCCAILGQDGISELRLVKLNMFANDNIYDVNHMADTLQELNCGGSGMTQKGISKLRLVTLDVFVNKNIHDLNHMADTLQHLMCGDSGITQNGISKLKLVTLDSDYNDAIYDLNHMADTLQELYIPQSVPQDGISKLKHTKIYIHP